LREPHGQPLHTACREAGGFDRIPSLLAGIEKELGQHYVSVTAMIAFLVVDEAAKAN